MVHFLSNLDKLKKTTKNQLHQVKYFTQIKRALLSAKLFSPLQKLKPIKQTKHLFIFLGRPLFLFIYFCLQALLHLYTSTQKHLCQLKNNLSNLSFSPPSLPTLHLPSLSPLSPKALLILISLTFSAGFFYLQVLHNLPSPRSLNQQIAPLSTQLYDRNGQLLFTFYKDKDRRLTNLQELPPHLIKATLAIEDQNFYQHQGLSISGILRAVKRNLTSTRLEGGSTITQQLIKNTLLNNQKTITRKLKEVILAVHTELIFSKDKILELYFNHIPYGGPAYGIQAAAFQYFNKPAKDLTLAESALLAGLPQAPTLYSPFNQPKLAKTRQKQVLKRMLAENYISPSQYQQALETPLQFSSPNHTIQAPHFVFYTFQKLIDHYGPQALYQKGLQVTTTLDLNLQHQAENILQEQLQKIQNLNVNNAAALITDPQTGQILTMVGSKNYFDRQNDGQVNLTTSLRQPGSAIKPINYALAFQNGFTPASIIQDTPITYQLSNQRTWTPRNYDQKFHGPITLRTALASSYNIPAIKLLNQNGITQMVELARNMGINTWNDPARFGLSLTLGSNEVKMTDLAEAYGTFANLGTHLKLNPILSITNSHHQPLSFTPCPNSSCQPKQVLKPSIAYLINDILSDPQARSPAFGYHSILNIPNHQVAVKTGTSNNLRDNWTIGYTTNRLVATWVGNNDNTPMNKIASGITGASPIWAQLFNNLLSSQKTAHRFPSPQDIVKVAICPLTNTLTCSSCPNPRMETFALGTQPTRHCNSQQIKALITPTIKQPPLAQNQPPSATSQTHTPYF